MIVYNELFHKHMEDFSLYFKIDDDYSNFRVYYSRDYNLIFVRWIEKNMKYVVCTGYDGTQKYIKTFRPEDFSEEKLYNALNEIFLSYTYDQIPILSSFYVDIRDQKLNELLK